MHKNANTMPPIASPSVTNPDRFAAIVQARRAELNLTQVDVKAAGGPSTVTLGKIENGQRPSARTLRKLDQVLRWSPGSAARTLSGGDPTPLDGPPPPPSDTHQVRLGPDVVPLDLAELTDLLAVSSRLSDSLRDDPDAPIAGDVHELTTLVTRIFARYATSVLERSGGPGRQLHPIVEMALAHLLDAPAEGADPAIVDDRNYRRWLAGKFVPDDDDSAARFRARWEAATGATRKQMGHSAE